MSSPFIVPKTELRCSSATALAVKSCNAFFPRKSSPALRSRIGSGNEAKVAPTFSSDSILEIRHVYLDLDEDGPASLHAIRTTGDVPAPNFVLDTSPEKNQVVWRVDGLDRAQAESLLRSLATQFRGDPAATDISRVLRVPGFRNWKYKERFLVRAIQQTDRIYQLRDFAVHEDSPDHRRDLNQAQEPARRMPSGHRSQSEADWAYAKRALARGDDPQEVMSRIADYRAQDKADPQYYAHHTVAKAQAEMRGERQSTTAPATPESTHIQEEMQH
jgi:hypothetical protein